MAKKFPERFVITKRGKFYWYPKPYIFKSSPWKNTRLPDDQYEAMIKAREYNKSLDAWRDGQVLPAEPEGSIGWLRTKYRTSKFFDELTPKSQKEYSRYLAMLPEKWLALPAAGLTPAAAFKFYEKHSEQKRKAEAMITTIRAMFSYGRLIGSNKDNPFSNLRISRNAPRDFVWTTQEITAMMDKAIEEGKRSIALAVRIAADTGQREGDIIAMRWNQYNGKTIKVRQGKTKAYIEAPCTRELKAMLDKTERNSTHIVVSEETKRPYKSDYFKHLFRDIANQCEIRKELWFLDFRRTCVVRLAEAGCTSAEIAAISGHSINECQKIFETYLPRNSEMAANAIKKLERVNKLKSRNGGSGKVGTES